MKKTVLTAMLVVGAVGMNAQEIRNTLSKENIRPLECEHIQKIDLANQDTIEYVYCGFQNAKYTSIVDIGSVFISSQASLDELIDALKTALKLKTENSSLTYAFSAAGSEFNTYDFNKVALYIQDGRKYTSISMKNLAKWIEYLETIQL